MRAKTTQKAAKLSGKTGRRPKSAIVEDAVPVEVKKAPKPAAPAKLLRVGDIPEEPGVVEDKSEAPKGAIEVFEGAPDLPARDPLRPDQDLQEAEKAEFKKLLDEKMSLKDRAKQLVKLAGYTDSKRAPVALRAIQVINEITGVTQDGTGEAPPMFNLPDGVKISINVETPKK